MALSDKTPKQVFAIIAPEFASLPPETIEGWLEIAGNWVDQGKWGSKYSTGLAYMAAHLIATSEKGGAAGAVTSERVGNVAVSYAAPNSDDALASTGYGATFLSLRRSLVRSPMVRR